MASAWEQSRPAAFTPEEQAANDAYEASRRVQNLQEVQNALAAQRDPAARQILMTEQQKLSQPAFNPQMFVEKETGNVFRQRGDGSFEYMGKAAQSAQPSGLPAAGSGSTGPSMDSPLLVGARKALIGIPGFVGDTVVNVGNYLERKFPLMAHEPRGGGAPGAEIGPTSMMPSEVLEKLVGLPQQSQGENIASDVVAGALSGGVAGLKSGAKKISDALATRAGAAAGAGGALGSDVVNQAFPNMGPLPGVVGGIGGALLTGGAQGIGPRGTGRVREAAASIPDAEFAQAKQNLASGQDLNPPVNLTAPQAFPSQSPLLQLQERLTQAPGAGPLMAQRLRNQGQDVEAAGQGLLDKIAPAQTAVDSSFAAQSAGIKAIRSARTNRADQVRDAFAFTVGAVPESDVSGISGQIRRLQQGFGSTSPAGKFIDTNILAPLQVAGGSKGRRALETNPTALDGILDGAKAKLDAPNIADQGIEARQMGRIRQAIDQYSGWLDRYRSNPQAGRDTFADLSNRVVNPLERGLPGQLAGGGSLIDMQHIPLDAGRITALLTDTQNLNGKSIVEGARAMNRQDPTAFPGLFRATLEKQMNDIGGQTGWTSDKLPGKLAAAWWGETPNSPQRTNFMAGIAGAAEGRMLSNVPPGQLANAKANPRFVQDAQMGAANVMKAIEMAGRGRGGLGGARETAELSPGTVASGAAVAGLTLSNQAPGMIRRMAAAIPGGHGTDLRLTQLLSAGTPESIDMLREMARHSPAEIMKAITWGAVPQITVQAAQQTPKE